MKVYTNVMQLKGTTIVVICTGNFV